MHEDRILIAIPMFNCEQHIGPLLQEVSQQADLLQGRHIDILVIDNGSLDSSMTEAQKALQAMSFGLNRVVQNSNNIGLGGSQKRAFSWAQGRDFLQVSATATGNAPETPYTFLIVLHGDHQASAEDILSLLRVIEGDSNLSAVLGSRFSLRSKRQGYSYVRVVGNLALNLIYSILAKKIIVDLGSGLNIFRIDHFDVNKMKIFSNGFTFNMDLLLSMISERRSFVYVPIAWRDFGQVSNARNFRVGWQALMTVLKWRFKKTE